MNASLASFDLMLLAAGASRRLPDRSKLVEPHRGMPLIAHILETVTGLAFGRRIIVTGPPYRDAVMPVLARYPGWEDCHNARALEGVGTSIAVGAARLCPSAGVFICLADMPGLAATDFHVLAGLHAGPDSICRPLHQGRPGHPVLFGSAYYPRLAALAGDEGAGRLIREFGQHCSVYESANPGVILDLDTEADFRANRQ